MDFSNLAPVNMFCPNCGHKVTGYKDERGGTRLQCDRCKVVMYSKFHNVKKDYHKSNCKVNRKQQFNILRCTGWIELSIFWELV